MSPCLLLQNLYTSEHVLASLTVNTYDTGGTISIYGFMILMGLVKLPSMYDYWQKDEVVFHYSAVAS